MAMLGGSDGSHKVTCKYAVTNHGDPLTNVMVTDDQLGDIGTATGTLPNNAACSPDLATDAVVVESIELTCEVSIKPDKIETKKIKWKLKTEGSLAATIESATISWPGSKDLKKVKLERAEILKDDERVAPSTTINEGDWLKAANDRRIDSGKTKKFEFTGDFPQKDDQPTSDFTLDVTFVVGCSVSY